jgi:hypothetical protein
MPLNIVPKNEPQPDAASHQLSRANGQRLSYGYGVKTSNTARAGQAMTAILPIDDEEMNSEAIKELVSIARLITYARQSAKGLKADFPVWCLDLALGAILQEIYVKGDQQPHFADLDEDQGERASRH